MGLFEREFASWEKRPHKGFSKGGGQEEVAIGAVLKAWKKSSRLHEACAHLETRHYYSFSTILQCLIVHIALGYRQLRESEFYREDPLVKRVLGLKSLPSVPTVSLMLSEFNDKSVAVQQALNRGLVLERLEKEALNTVTSDFDGSVQSTNCHAEGTAVGFNKEKKEALSYRHKWDMFRRAVWWLTRFACSAACWRIT